MALWLLLACGARPSSAPTLEVASVRGPSVDARAWALRAYRAELLGEPAEADRSWQWARRADSDAAVFHGESLVRRGRGREAINVFREGMEGGAADRARLGLTALGEGLPQWLPELQVAFPCRLWWSVPDAGSEASCRVR